jgi:DNA polymerase-3 subunit beta
MRCITTLGKAEDAIAVKSAEGPPLEIGFNNRYLLDAIKAAPCDDLKLCLGSATSPCVIRPDDENESFLYMILPVRLKAD